MNDLKPTKIERQEGDKLRITWSDGFESVISLSDLRDNCPCASCTSDNKPVSGLQAMVESSLKEQKTLLQKLEPVGNYALRPIWGDGHDIGIYRFEHIREICEKFNLK